MVHTKCTEGPDPMAHIKCTKGPDPMVYSKKTTEDAGDAMRRIGDHMKQRLIRQFHTWFQCLALVFALTCIVVLGAGGAAAEDAEKTGSITIHELSGDDHQTAVGGIRLSICNITNSYEEIRAAIEAGTVESLVPEAERTILDTQVSDAGSGTVTFRGLSRGVYLIWQTNQAEDFAQLGYTAECEAFLVQLPKTDEKGNEEWNVTCSPKVKVDRTPEKTQVMVLKKWEDNFDALKLRPTSIEVGLYKDGDLYDTVTLSAAQNWQHSWTDLEKDAVWTVKEIKVPKYYSTEVTSEGLTFTITNTLLPTPGGSKDEPPTEKPPEDEPETGDTPISDTPPSTPNGGTPRTPVKTGDTTPIIGMSLLLMSAGITIILLINKRRRRSR